MNHEKFISSSQITTFLQITFVSRFAMLGKLFLQYHGICSWYYQFDRYKNPWSMKKRFHLWFFSSSKIKAQNWMFWRWIRVKLFWICRYFGRCQFRSYIFFTFGKYKLQNWRKWNDSHCNNAFELLRQVGDM